MSARERERGSTELLYMLLDAVSRKAMIETRRKESLAEHHSPFEHGCHGDK